MNNCDIDLVNKAKAGDKEAFTKLISNYKKEMYCIAMYNLKSEVDIDDAIQETLYKAYVNIRKLKEPKYFGTWLIRILINCCKDIQREHKAVILSFEDENLEKIPDDSDPYLDIVNHYDFFEMIDGLDQDEKELITLKYSQHYDNKDLAELLQIKEGALRMRFMRIRDKLKMKFKGGNRYEQ